MYNVKIYGAGSIGNHLAYACRQMGWDVTVCDISDEALSRMKNEIYPSRYGLWDESIMLFNNKDMPRGDFDLIIIGTPPEHHIPLALESILESPRGILVEKPLCTPSMEQAHEFYEKARRSSTKIFVGYDHVVGKATQRVEEIIKNGVIGEISTIDVAFREHWQGIFDSHSWLSGPEDTYLGFWKLGGGASGEHSHAVNLWQHFAHMVGAGRVVEIEAMLNYVEEGKAKYDNLCLMQLRTENGMTGRVVQDVISLPSRKYAFIQGNKGALKWVNNYKEDSDAVLSYRPSGKDEVNLIPKKRPDDFIEELKHIQSQLKLPKLSSGISLERGLDTMLIVAAAHLSEQKKSRVKIDYNRGYTEDALKVMSHSC